MQEDPAASDVVSLYRGILREHGVALTPETTILDYGCGTGRHTYQFIDAGFLHTYGYDVVDCLYLREPIDRYRFRIDPRVTAEMSPPTTLVPWPDDTFDFVYATSVFEHVSNQDFAFAEVARVLKPGGVFLNMFPSRWRPIEPHMYVPFGGVTKSRAWFYFWARLGIRNEFQQDLPAVSVAEVNHRYAQEGINYLSGAEIDAIVERHFSSYAYIDGSFVKHSRGRSRHLAPAFKVLPPLKSLFRLLHTRVILARK